MIWIIGAYDSMTFQNDPKHNCYCYWVLSLQFHGNGFGVYSVHVIYYSICRSQAATHRRMTAQIFQLPGTHWQSWDPARPLPAEAVQEPRVCNEGTRLLAGSRTLLTYFLEQAQKSHNAEHYVSSMPDSFWHPDLLRTAPLAVGDSFQKVLLMKLWFMKLHLTSASASQEVRPSDETLRKLNAISLSDDMIYGRYGPISWLYQTRVQLIFSPHSIHVVTEQIQIP